MEFQVECTWKMILWVMAQGVIPLGVCIMRPIFLLLPALPGSLLTHCLTLIMIAITGKIFRTWIRFYTRIHLCKMQLQCPPCYRYIGTQWANIWKKNNLLPSQWYYQQMMWRIALFIHDYTFPFLAHCAVFEGRCILYLQHFWRLWLSKCTIYFFPKNSKMK